ncbi:hypothetical protein [Litchfieldella xinjiangensis]|uniref:hypothetical protein n=1 Tax=Litchfieldella xinjiangensis TaxID=1166948 RepID=UPI0012E030B9|nr:hypothetical protein [Halomonas xinjiangensis]
MNNIDLIESTIPAPPQATVINNCDRLAALVIVVMYKAGSRKVDANNLQKLAQLKEQIAQSEREAKKLTLDTYDFSEAARLSLEKRREQLGQPEYPPEVFDPAIPSRDVTVQVKRKKKGKKRPSSSGTSPERTKSGNLKKRKDIHDPTVPTFPCSSEPTKSRKWITKLCKMCSRKIHIHVDWKSPSLYCKSCRSTAASLRKNKKANSFTPQYTHCAIYQGGAPGGGKRR